MESIFISAPQEQSRGSISKIVRSRRVHVRRVSLVNSEAIPVAGSLFRYLGAFPVSRENPESSALKIHMALKTGATILPVAIHGGERVWGPMMTIPFPLKVRVEYLEPITPLQFEGTVEVLTAQVRRAIVHALGVSSVYSRKPGRNGVGRRAADG